MEEAKNKEKKQAEKTEEKEKGKGKGKQSAGKAKKEEELVNMGYFLLPISTREGSGGFCLSHCCFDNMAEKAEGIVILVKHCNERDVGFYMWSLFEDHTS